MAALEQIDSKNDYNDLKEYMDSLRKYYKELHKQKKEYDKALFNAIAKTKVEKPKLADINKIALPLDAEFVDDFITEFLATKDTIVYENLISVITEGLGLVSYTI